ncbi:MAG: hypothetical protein ACRCVT_13255 [Leadbetterella sp.]
MKYILFPFALLLFVFTTGLAQNSIFKGRTYYENQEQTSYFYLTRIEEKNLRMDLKEWIDGFGNVKDVNKNTYKIEKLKGNKWSDEINTIIVQLQDFKHYNKVVFYFFDKRDRVLENATFRDQEAMDFIEQFQNVNLKKEELRIAIENLEDADDDLKDAVKDSEKTQRAIEKNLKEQEKLGKKLDASPEAITKAITSKEDIVSKMSDENTSQEAKEKLAKESTSKEKEIKKIQKQTDKAETKLSKKEKEFDELTTELIAAKRKVKAMEAIKMDAEIIKNKLEKIAKI